MEVFGSYRSRPLHLSEQGLAARLQPQAVINQPIPLSPNTLLSFQSPQELDSYLTAQAEAGPSRLSDRNSFLDLYGDSPTTPSFQLPTQHGPTTHASRRPSIKIVQPDDGQYDDAYGGTEDDGEPAEAIAERTSWNSATLGRHQLGQTHPRESTVSAVTMGSETDPFQYSVSLTSTSLGHARSCEDLLS